MLYRGKINLILGPMFSGKTSTLISRYNRYTIGGKKCLMVKYKHDTRYDNKSIVTHDNIKLDAIVCEYLYEIDHLVKNYDVICIDEIQFYKDAHIFCDKWANNNLIIEACGLNGTFERKPFDIISKLLPLVENITYLTAICRETGNEATYSYRKTSETQEEVIGGSDKYSAVDRQTYFKNNRDYIYSQFRDFINLYSQTNKIEIEENKINEFIDYLKRNNQDTNNFIFIELLYKYLDDHTLKN